MISDLIGVLMKKIIALAWFIFLGLSMVGYLLIDPTAEKKPFSFLSSERESPGDWLVDEQIKVMKNMVVIKEEDVILSSFADTNSMDPLLDENSNGLEIKPVKEKLKVGDVISYRSEVLGGVVIHRIIEIGYDEQGTYYLVQGDNNNFRDPEKVRFEQIEGVLIGVLY